MTALEELITREKDNDLRVALQERVDIVEHKIKFMDKVSLCMLDTQGQVNIELTSFLQIAGAVLTLNPMDAEYVIVYQKGAGMTDLLSSAAGILNAEWPASQQDKIYFLADCYPLEKAGGAISMIEDIAEILHPGQFVFSFEGDKWIKFRV